MGISHIDSQREGERSSSIPSTRPVSARRRSITTSPFNGVCAFPLLFRQQNCAHTTPDWIKNGLKKLLQRLEFWCLFLALGILIDEFIKEGYLFRFEEVFTFEVTHEKFVVGFLIAFVCVFLYNRLRKCRAPLTNDLAIR
jgi:hypothetical protein